ncbi:MAG: GreA/GreB family elongation factor [Flavobacteriales bacterium]|nr:GreA/GreB family elongation factor [Flavobacteriales bacterium]
MSRGFVREDDQEEAPFIPPRAPLPDGVANYVTPRGLEQLLLERTALTDERANAGGSDDERRRTQAEMDGRLALLQERINTARVVEVATDHDEVRFGNTVTVLHLSGPLKDQRHSWTIVGVDEASVKEHRIAFTAPLARALMGHRTGDTVEMPAGAAPQRFRIIAIT